MAGKPPESGIPLLRDLLGLSTANRANSPNFRPPIFISIPTLSSEKKGELPLTLSILDLLDLPHLSPQNLLSTHTFTTKLALCWTRPPSSAAAGKMKATPVFVTKNSISLSHLLPEDRDLLFVSTGVPSDSRPLKSALRSLGLTSRAKTLGIVDIDMLAKDVVVLGIASSVTAILNRLECSAENGCEETAFVMRAMLLLVLESCKVGACGQDEIGNVWVEVLRAIAEGPKVVQGPMEVVRKGVKAIFRRVKRSAGEIERIRAERRRKKQDLGASEEVVTEMRLWDGMWELL